MTMSNNEFSILLPAFFAGLLVTATHVPLGIQVLNRGIVFIDIAIAQIAGVGVIAAAFFGYEDQALAVQISALTAALLGALLLTWTERRWPAVQEAIIGSVFVLAATLEILLLAGNPNAGEHLKDMLVGQILWVGHHQLAVVAALTIVILAAWFGIGMARLGRVGFYLLFGLAVTASVQMVGIYLVFSSLIIPALASRNATRLRLAKAYVVGALGYLFGLIASILFDLPTGALIVWAMAGVGVALSCVERGPSAVAA
ncbi:MAG TPA: metal ABC transporter permease [Burkholderiales bacterium]|jgi:zinc/manganese transport system permease protein|nr:metal ABC transporter permease [Burkholderiales bacterium]